MNNALSKIPFDTLIPTHFPLLGELYVSSTIRLEIKSGEKM